MRVVRGAHTRRVGHKWLQDHVPWVSTNILILQIRPPGGKRQCVCKEEVPDWVLHGTWHSRRSNHTCTQQKFLTAARKVLERLLSCSDPVRRRPDCEQDRAEGDTLPRENLLGSDGTQTRFVCLSNKWPRPNSKVPLPKPPRVEEDTENIAHM